MLMFPNEGNIRIYFYLISWSVYCRWHFNLFIYFSFFKKRKSYLILNSSPLFTIFPFLRRVTARPSFTLYQVTRSYRGRIRERINMSRHPGQRDIGGSAIRCIRVAEYEVHWESDIEWGWTVDLSQVLVRQDHTQCFYVGLEMFNFPLTDNGENRRCLMHHVGECLLIVHLRLVGILYGFHVEWRNKIDTHDCMESSVFSFSDFLQRTRYFDIILAHVRSSATAVFANASTRLRGLEFALAERCPWRNCHALIPTHRDNLSFKIPESSIPFSLVHRKRPQPVNSSVFICLYNHPSWGVRNTEIENLARIDQVV